MLAPSSCYCLIDLEYGLMGADWYRILSSKGVAMAAARTGDETKLGARAEGRASRGRGTLGRFRRRGRAEPFQNLAYDNRGPVAR
jgi:hypothetical protein